MLLKYDDPISKEKYSFDIEFNEVDCCVQIDTDDKLYNEVFSLKNINSKNSFFDSIDIIKKVIIKCIEQEEGFSLIIKKEKTLKLIFTMTTSLDKSIDLYLELLPIRKDVSNSTEIIELKRKLKLMESCISPNFIITDKILTPINSLYEGPICFSSEIYKEIKFSYQYINGSTNQLYDIMSGSHCGTNPSYSKKTINRLHLQDVYDGSRTHLNFRFDGFLNYPFINSEDILFAEMKRLKSTEICFFNCKLSSNLYKFLPKNIKKLYLIDIKVEDDFNEFLSKTINNCKSLKDITIYSDKNKINTVDIDIARPINISLYGAKPTSYNKDRLPKNIKIIVDLTY